MVRSVSPILKSSLLVEKDARWSFFETHHTVDYAYGMWHLTVQGTVIAYRIKKIENMPIELVGFSVPSGSPSAIS